MSLLNALTDAKSEEDVKAAYIKAIGLKLPNQGKVDIQAPNMWFEAKEAATPAITMFAQLLWYVRDARAKGEPIPAFLTVIDREKAAIMETELAIPALNDPAIDWPQSASSVGKACIGQVADYIDGHFRTYTIAHHEKEFLTSIKSALDDGRIIKTPITRANLRQVFNKWIDAVGKEMVVPNEGDYASLFFADIMHDGYQEAMTGLSARLLQNAGKPLFLMKDGRTFELASLRGYRNFWQIFDRPPKVDDRHYLLERRDILLPFDEQKFKGAFYTPLHIVDKAYDLLAKTLGEGWQEEYIIWDMCCGVGNLEMAHSNPRNLFMSTLDQEDIDGMKSRGTFAGVEMFQYDYLNDDVTDFGEIDYNLSNKLPPALRTAIADAKAGKAGAKKILVLINPPYAEMTSGGNTAPNAVSSSKIGVAKTLFASSSMARYGKAKNELFMQFIVRVYQEIPSAKLAIFSKMKYISTPTLDDFRKEWSAEYLGGFAVDSRSFDGLTGNFPIGFLIWDTTIPTPISDVFVTALDKAGNQIGNKSYINYDGKLLLTDWIDRPPSNREEVVPLKNAIVPATADKDLRGTRWSKDAIGWLNCAGNDLQNAGSKTMLFSSGYGSARGLFVNADNIENAAVIFSVRLLIKQTWLNDRDQFLQPSAELTDAFKSDSLIWMLFNGSNLSAGADGLRWNDRDWSLVNHFIPFTEGEVGAKGRFESDFMAKYIARLTLSPEAKAVMDAGRALWSQFHATQFAHKIRDEYKLGRPDAGWYQIRKAMEANSENEPVNFAPFKSAYAALGDKLRPMVFELGFLPK